MEQQLLIFREFLVIAGCLFVIDNSNGSSRDDSSAAVSSAAVSSVPKLSSFSKANEGSTSKSSKKEYREFISLIDDEDDWLDTYAEKEDADFLAAIDASLLENAKHEETAKETIEELFSKLMEETGIFPSDDDEGQYVNMIVHRRFVYQSTVRGIGRKYVCPSFLRLLTAERQAQQIISLRQFQPKCLFYFQIFEDF